jgi:hypothetical protein
MKKQILLFVLFVVATFASVSKSYGQSCTTDALHPQANVAYHYTTLATGGTFDWFVTTNPDIKAKAKETAGTLFSFTGTSNTTNDVVITWTAAAITLAKTTPIYVALWYQETVNGCTVENVRAIQIAPVNTFLLAITGIDGAGASITTTCAAPVLTAVVDHPASASQDNTNASMAITYGTNTITYKITASGMDGNWSPRIRIPALTAPQTYTSVQWSTNNSTWSDFSTSATSIAGGDYTATTTDVPVTVAGSYYYVRLLINQGSFESLSDQPIAVSVDGYLATDHTLSDVVASNNCAEETAFGKSSTVTISKRPTITPGVPAFMTKNP